MLRPCGVPSCAWSAYSDDLLFRKSAALFALVLVLGQSEVQTGLSPRGRSAKKWPRLGAIFELVVPVSTLLLDNHGAFTAILVPASMQAAVMTVVLRTGAAELTGVALVPIHVPVTAN